MDVPEIQFSPECLRELVVGEQKFRSSCDYRLTREDLQKARTELKETDEVREVALRKLRDMLDKDEDFTFRTDDVYLLRYLRHRKFNVIEAYDRLRKFYAMRNELPEMCHMSSTVRSMLDTKMGYMFPYSDKEGKLLFLAKLGNWNPDELNALDIICLFTPFFDIVSMNPHIQINGLFSIWDTAGVRLSHLSEVLRPSTLRLMLKLAQDLYPWRITYVILINCSAIVYAGMSTVRMLLKKKIADRLVFLRSDLSQLHEYVNPSLLPKEYGGSLEDEECYSFTGKFMFGNERYLEYEQSFIRTKKR